MTIHVRVANADRLALVALADVLRPPPPVNFESWAVSNIQIPDGDYRGPYDPRLFPFWSGPLAALGPDDPCRIVTLKKSAQVGGTVLGNIFALGSLDMDPGAFGFVHPSDANATIWSKTKFDGMLAQNPRLKALFPPLGEPGNSSSMKMRRDGRGHVEIASAISPSGLSQRTWVRQVQDDLAKWSTNETGDPEQQAETRSEAIEFAKILKISTPLIEPGCRISRAYASGSMERYVVPCPHCHGMQALTWGNMRRRFEAGEAAGRFDDVGFSCEHCGADIDEHHRAWMVDPANGARWIARRPERFGLHRSFEIWAAYGPLTSWSRIVEKWRDVRGDPGREQVFLNDTAGEAYDGDSKTPEIESLVKRAAIGHRRGIIPAGHWLLYAGADVQEDRVEVHLRAYGSHGRAATVDYLVIPHGIGTDECRRRLDDLLRASWPHAAGGRIAIDRFAIDAGYDSGAVTAWVRRHPSARVMMVKGLAGPRTSFLTQLQTRREKTGKPTKSGSRLFGVAVDEAKLHLYARLKVEDPQAPQYQAFPQGLDEGWFEQLVSERRVKDRDRNGFEVVVWKLPPGRRNEVLDTAVYAEAAARKDGVREMPDAAWDRIASERGVAPAQTDLEDMMSPTRAPVPPAPVAVPPPSQSGGWIGARTGWMNRR